LGTPKRGFGKLPDKRKPLRNRPVGRQAGRAVFTEQDTLFLCLQISFPVYRVSTRNRALIKLFIRRSFLRFWSCANRERAAGFAPGIQANCLNEKRYFGKGFETQKSPVEHKSNRAKVHFHFLSGSIIFRFAGKRVPAHKNNGFF